jgi:hypothetical protein
MKTAHPVCAGSPSSWLRDDLERYAAAIAMSKCFVIFTPGVHE